MTLDNFEKILLDIIEGEHFRRNSCSIKECKISNCWFNEMEALIKKAL